MTPATAIGSCVNSGPAPRCGVASPPSWDVGEWIGVIGLLSVGIGALASLFRGNNKKIHDRITEVEDTVKEATKTVNDHAVQLERVTTCQENTRDRLEKIDETTKETHQEMKSLSETVTKVLLAIQVKG